MRRLNEKGALFVEFALILPLFLYLVFSMIYMGLYIHDVNALNEATRASARYASVDATKSESNAKGVLSTMGNNLILYTVDSGNSSVEYTTLSVGSGSSAAEENAVRVIGKAKLTEAVPLLVDAFISEEIQASIVMHKEATTEESTSSN